MKHIFIVVILFLGQIELNAQMDTIIVYDISSQTEKIIPIGPFDTIAMSDYVTGNSGQWEDILQLDLELPNNLPPTASFSELVLAKNHYDLLQYPIRTSVAIVWSDSIFEQIATCSGALIANNIVLTAAHCFGKHVNGEFIWKPVKYVSPSHSDGFPQPSIGKIKVDKYVILKKFDDQGTYNFTYDIGLLILKEPIGDLIGWLGYGFNENREFYTNQIFYSFSYPGPNEFSGFDMYSYYGIFNNINIEYGRVSHGVYGVNGMSGSNFFYTNNELHISYGQQTHASKYRLIRRENFYAIKEIDKLYNVGIQELDNKKSSINVYPNPMTDYSTIEIVNTDLYNEKLTFVLYDLYGTECYKTSNINKSLFVLKRGKLIAGMYFFLIQSETKIVGNGKLMIK